MEGVFALYRDPSAMTIHEAYERFHIWVLRGERAAPATYATYRSALAAWKQYGSPELQAGEIRQSHLLAWRAAMLDEGYSAYTWQSYWHIVRAILSTCGVEGEIEGLPRTPRIKSLMADPKPRPSVQEFAALYQACDQAYWPHVATLPAPLVWRSWLALALMTGQRRGDILRLRWCDIYSDGIRLEPEKTVRHSKWAYCPNVDGVLTRILEPFDWNGEFVFGKLNWRGDVASEIQRNIADAAGVPRELATFHPIRRLSVDLWTMAHPQAGDLISGRGITVSRVTRRHYLGKDAERSAIEEIMRSAARRFEIPGCLSERKQRTLNWPKEPEMNGERYGDDHGDAGTCQKPRPAAGDDRSEARCDASGAAA